MPIVLEYDIEQRRLKSLFAKKPSGHPKQGMQEVIRLWSAELQGAAATRRQEAWFRKSTEFSALKHASAAPAKKKFEFSRPFWQRARRSYRGAHASFSVSFQRLLDLLDEKGKDDHGAVDPTQFAFKTASEFVLKAESMLGGRDIRSAPVVDSEGGIRITWKSGNKKVKLICPATPNSPVYIYQSSPTASSVHNQDVTVEALADRLSWLLHGDQAEQSAG